MTRQQRKAFEFIRDQLNLGVSPTIAAISAGLSLESRKGAFFLLTGLERLGYIRRLAPLNDRSRTIEIIKHPPPLDTPEIPLGACAIPLTRGRVALVDEGDFDALAAFTWQASHGYAKRCMPGASKLGIFMHRQIMGAEPGQIVDHASGDTLDNRRRNLRFATPSQSSANRRTRAGVSGFRGVFYSAPVSQWAAKITVNYRQIHLGRFETPIEAARRYDEAAREHHGEFAVLNFPGEARP